MILVRAYTTFMPGWGSRRFEKSLANVTLGWGLARYRLMTTRPGDSALTSCQEMESLSARERGRSRSRAKAPYDGDRLHSVNVPAGIGGSRRSQGASGVVRISKFEK